MKQGPATAACVMLPQLELGLSAYSPAVVICSYGAQAAGCNDNGSLEPHCEARVRVESQTLDDLAAQDLN